jgi:hypothetical protein
VDDIRRTMRIDCMRPDIIMFFGLFWLVKPLECVDNIFGNTLYEVDAWCFKYVLEKRLKGGLSEN